VQRLADEAVATFGHSDVWINCAGVIAYGVPARRTVSHRRDVG
jgi:NAD(P)-dependent dehydrogenase (short-subunit alcohol dehydrogenase family)